MLDPEYLNTCADEILGIYDNLQTAAAQDIAKSLVTHGGTITSTAAWQAERLMAAGETMNDIVQDVADITVFSDDAIRRAFTDAANEGLMNDAEPLVNVGQISPDDLQLSEPMLQTLEATIVKTQGDLTNLTLTTGSTAFNQYMEQSNIAYMRVASGETSYSKAIADAVRNSAAEGSWVLYGQRADGSYIRSRLDVAVRRSVLTGVNQTCGKITEMWAEDMGCEYYEVSAHLGARPSHEEWQGQVYKIDGADEHYRNFYDETGYGTGEGLCGYNCRHSFYPYWPGISKPAYSKETLDEYAGRSYEYAGKQYTEYQCSQIQRGYEREIRDEKRVLASYDAAMQYADPETRAELKDRFDAGSVALKQTEREMKNFCNATNRKTDSVRTQVVAYKDSSGRIVNFGRSTSMRAVWADRKANQ